MKNSHAHSRCHTGRERKADKPTGSLLVLDHLFTRQAVQQLFIDWRHRHVNKHKQRRHNTNPAHRHSVTLHYAVPRARSHATFEARQK